MYILILALMLVTGEMQIITKTVGKHQECVETAKAVMPALEADPKVVAYTFACPKLEMA